MANYNKDSIGFEVTETKVVYVVEADIQDDGGFIEEDFETLCDFGIPYCIYWLRRELTNKFFQVIGGPKIFDRQSFNDQVMGSRSEVFEDLDLSSIDTLTDPVTGEDIDVYSFDYSALPEILGCTRNGN